jgi:hypothetical protein
MAKKLICKLRHEWGEKVFVGGKLLEISKADGLLDVDEDVAALLLQNADKWADATVKTPFKKPSGPPQPILSDKAGNVLSVEETAQVLKQEPAEEPWPVADESMSKADLFALCDRLKVAGHIHPSLYSPRSSRNALLDAIEAGYDAMKA